MWPRLLKRLSPCKRRRRNIPPHLAARVALTRGSRVRFGQNGTESLPTVLAAGPSARPGGYFGCSPVAGVAGVAAAPGAAAGALAGSAAGALASGWVVAAGAAAGLVSSFEQDTAARLRQRAKARTNVFMSLSFVHPRDEVRSYPFQNNPGCQAQPFQTTLNRSFLHKESDERIVQITYSAIQGLHLGGSPNSRAPKRGSERSQPRGEAAINQWP